TIDLAALVAAHGGMEGHVADIARDGAGKLYGGRALLRLFSPAFILPLEPSVALGHLRSITRLCLSTTTSDRNEHRRHRVQAGARGDLDGRGKGDLDGEGTTRTSQGGS